MTPEILNKKEVFIFDVDGTLYSQRKMRLKMALSLLFFYLFRFWRLKELLLLKAFRKVREKEEFRTENFESQLFAACQKVDIDTSKGKAIIENWMFKKPLEIIKSCSFENLISFIEQVQKQGKQIIIYSDYPAFEKLEALGIKASSIFTPEAEEIGELKPSKKAMSFIMSTISKQKENILYIGDRDEKDGTSAALAEIDYCDIRKFLKLLCKEGEQNDF